MDNQSWIRDSWDKDPRFEGLDATEHDPNQQQALAGTVDGRLRQIEFILGELLSGGGDDRFRVTVWEKNPQTGIRKARLDALTITDNYATERGRIN